MKSLKGKVAIVTGGSRGIGKGVALGLGELGAIVYVTGRTETGEGLPDFLKDTNIYKTAEEITGLGGVGIPYKCDHAKDEEVELLFKKVVEKEGRIDILVNNAWGGGAHVMGGYFFNTPFWQQPVSLLEDQYTVGLRSNYVASKFAAEVMTKQKQGLIINISFFGGRRYWNNVAYGVCKAAVDKLSADTAHELKDYGVSVFSLYPGNVSTEGMLEYAKYDKGIDIEKMESPQFIGRCIAALATDEKAIKDTGKILIAAEVAKAYDVIDIDGKQPESLRQQLW
ncbi:dehydrogenase/reductase SDR family member 1 [Natronincola peptidivorans]|uniref:Dehydrogenase/reductase SDR family member 1 n=1 Tax=Natronincola peptidivorans TaxID=426128 RepID=A0A1I0AZ70_9FIRM|nr:SDR family NAD(P)-dependent oxidoreductase [Natronincola peptidivorans]SES99324.1 dehydrogenase/reductase SDR family member 1 [Natronincola peptidivorans]